MQDKMQIKLKLKLEKISGVHHSNFNIKWKLGTHVTTVDMSERIDPQLISGTLNLSALINVDISLRPQDDGKFRSRQTTISLYTQNAHLPFAVFDLDIGEQLNNIQKKFNKPQSLSLRSNPISGTEYKLECVFSAAFNEGPEHQQSNYQNQEDQSKTKDLMTQVSHLQRQASQLQIDNNGLQRQLSQGQKSKKEKAPREDQTNKNRSQSDKKGKKKTTLKSSFPMQPMNQHQVLDAAQKQINLQNQVALGEAEIVDPSQMKLLMAQAEQKYNRLQTMNQNAEKQKAQLKNLNASLEHENRGYKNNIGWNQMQSGFSISPQQLQAEIQQAREQYDNQLMDYKMQLDEKDLQKLALQTEMEKMQKQYSFAQNAAMNQQAQVQNMMLNQQYNTQAHY